MNWEEETKEAAGDQGQCQQLRRPTSYKLPVEVSTQLL